jgi:hypothetical protein
MGQCMVSILASKNLLMGNKIVIPLKFDIWCYLKGRDSLYTLVTILVNKILSRIDAKMFSLRYFLHEA